MIKNKAAESVLDFAALFFNFVSEQQNMFF